MSSTSVITKYARNLHLLELKCLSNALWSLFYKSQQYSDNFLLLEISILSIIIFTQDHIYIPDLRPR